MARQVPVGPAEGGRSALARSVAEIAAAVGGVVEGDGLRQIRAVAGLEMAVEDEVAFLSNRKYTRLFLASRAGCVLVTTAEPAHGRTVIRCDDPYLAFAKALELFHPRAAPVIGVHPAAVVGAGATIAPGCALMAFSYVGDRAVVGAGSVLHPHSYVGPGATVGRDCVLMAGSVVEAGCTLGDRVVLNPGAVVGGEGFGFVPTASGLYKIPQTGRAIVEDDVEIGSNTCIDRAAVGDTVVKAGSKLDNLVQVGHGATIGRHCLLVSYAAVAGSATLGDGVVMAMKSGVVGHLDIGAGTQIAAFALVTEDTPPGARRGGVPAIDHHAWLNVTVAARRLPELVHEAALREREIAALRTELSDLKAAVESELVELRRANRPKEQG